jgi:hypothetical protein
LNQHEQILPLPFIISASKTEHQILSTEKLIVELDARTAKLDAKIANTDKRLDELDGTVKKTDGSLNKFSGAAKLAGSAITAVATAGVAAAAALTAATAQAVSYAKEITIASRRSGENVERLQSLAFATGTVGVSLEKLGDITKDTNEKVGEFLADGTGGFLDFVSVAKLTSEEADILADRFKTMTGPDILQAMVTRMEEAGATAKEMSFALEGMASDTTDLIPLLANGGKELKLLEDDFNDLNVTLTALDIEKITKLGIETSKLGAEVQNASSKTVAVLSDEIGQIAQLLAGSAQDVGGLVIKAVTGYQAIVVTATSNLMNMFREAEILALEAKSFIVGVFGDNSDIEEELSKLKASDALRDAFDATFLAEQWEAAKLKVSEYYGEIESRQEDSPDIEGPTDLDAPEERVSEKKQKELDALREFTLTRADLLDAELLADIERLELAAETFGLKDEELYARRLEIVRNFNDQKSSLENDGADDFEKSTKKEVRANEKAANEKLNKQQTGIRAGMALNTLLFEDNKAIAAGLIVADTAAAIMASLKIAPYDYFNVGLIATTGAVQFANALSSSKGGGGSMSAPTGSGTPQQAPEPVDDFNDQGATITDISEGQQSTQRLVIEFNDEVVDAISRQIQKSQSDGRT